MASGVSGKRLLLAIFGIAFLGMFQNVGGTGQIEIHFLLYTDDCDEDFHTNKCDPMFTFCLSTPQKGRLKVNNCNYASTGESNDVFPNTNHIDMEYRTSIGGHKNPWIVQVPRFIEPSVMLVIKVVDADIIEDDHMQTWGTTLNERVWPSKEQSVWQERVMSQNTYTMKFRVRMYCDPYYYTIACDKYCKPADSSQGHYTCDPVTGDKKCLPGWRGSECTEDIDECSLGYCVRGDCTNTPGDYICNCPPNYTDKNCSSLMNPCRYQPCQNGGTCYAHATDHINICQCTPEWEGTSCESRKTACGRNPCLNNGTCINSPDGNYNCSCVAPYTGINCETAATTTISSSLKTETTTSPETPQTISAIPNAETSSNPPPESQDANVQHLLQEESRTGFQLWYIAIILAVLLLLLVVLAVLFVRRRKNKAALGSFQTSPIVSYSGNNLNFDNGMYATVNRNNSELDRQTRQLPPVPGSYAQDEPRKSTYAEVNENEQATGGSKPDDSGMKKSASDCQVKGDSAFGGLTRPVNERAQTNPYADFKSLRDSQVAMNKPDYEISVTVPTTESVTVPTTELKTNERYTDEGHQEEGPYHDLDDITAQMHDDDELNDSTDGAFSYIIPDTPIVTVQASPYDTPPNNSSYYDTPKTNLPSPLVPEQKYEDLTPSGDITNNSAPYNDFTTYVNALDSDSNDEEDTLQEDILKLRQDVELQMPPSTES